MPRVSKVDQTLVKLLQALTPEQFHATMKSAGIYDQHGKPRNKYRAKPKTQQQIGQGSRTKGKGYERELAQELRELLNMPSIKRGIGQARAAGEVADVDGVPLFWVEAKREKSTKPKEALAQAEQAITCDGAQTGAIDKLPLAVCRDDGARPIAVMFWGDFKVFLQQWWFRNRPHFKEDNL
jgi:hypothetical protein